MAKNALAKLGTPTAGAGKIPRAHRYQHENLADDVTKLQTQVATLQSLLGVPGVAGAPGQSLVLQPGMGDNQGSGLGSDNQGTPRPPIYVPTPAPQPIGGVSLPPIIAFWHTSKGSIPTGWALCDGTNGTPDLITGNPLLQMGATSSLSAGTNVNLTVSGTTDATSLPNTCNETQGTGSTVNVVIPPTSHTHTFSTTLPVGADVLKPTLTRYQLIPIMWTGG